MAEVSVDKLKAGSVLARDVMLPEGILLVKGGVQLNERLIVFLKRRGIRTVFIDGGGNPDRAPRAPDSVYEERLARLNRMFAPVEGTPHMTAIKTAVRARLRFRRSWE